MVQPCITWGTRKVGWYRDRVYKLGDDYDSGSLQAALEKTTEWGEKIPIGILYQAKPAAVFGQRFRKSVESAPLPEIPPPKPDMIEAALEGYYAK